jgi:hypothetical protein
MNNILSITTLPNGCVKTEIFTSDGVSCIEIHRIGLSDAKVLYNLLNKKFYQQFSGEWFITFIDDQHVITSSTFEIAIDTAQQYIFRRDNSTDYSGYC